ncbi:MAG: hypothetical protein GY903_09305 [Fuerstiella sp.]|nr:hypothetical protein [Fuerstiella sp.]MCP4854678.1 hypothetical protein [Fuerstiella sp.]
MSVDRHGQSVGLGDGILLRPDRLERDAITVVVRICYAYGDLSSSPLTSPCEHASR